jgi:hypothetical protein
MAKSPGQRTRNWSATWRGVACCNRPANQLFGGSGAVHLSGINVVHAPIQAEEQSGDD